jgi:hypothetical protein
MNLDVNQILIFFRIFFTIFKIVRKSLDLVIMNHSKDTSNYLKKNSKI